MKKLYSLTTQVLFKERILRHKTKVMYLDDKEYKMLQEELLKKKTEKEDFLDFSIEEIQKNRDAIFLKDMSIEDFEEYVKSICKGEKE